MLIFITVSIVDKPALSVTDWSMMVLFWLCLVAGFLIIVPSSVAAGQWWLAFSCATYIPVLYLPFYDTSLVLWSGGDEDPAMAAARGKVFAERFAQRTNLALWLTVVFPWYTVNYLFGLYNLYGYDVTIAIYQILSVLTKVGAQP